MRFKLTFIDNLRALNNLTLKNCIRGLYIREFYRRYHFCSIVKLFVIDTLRSRFVSGLLRGVSMRCFPAAAGSDHK